jgi:hypothetical protein
MKYDTATVRNLVAKLDTIDWDDREYTDEE